MVKREPWNPLLKLYPESRKINAVSLGAEAMFCRLIALSDDHANYYGGPRLLLTHLWGHRWANRTMSLHKCARFRNELVLAALVSLYRVGSSEYLHVVNCKKMLRADIKEDVRFPDLTEAVDPEEFAESVPNAARIRYESGSSCVVPPSTSTSTSTEAEETVSPCLLSAAFKNGGTPAQREKFTPCVQAALALGATPRLLLSRLTPRPDDPWVAVRQAGKDAKAMLKEFGKLIGSDCSLADVAGVSFDPTVPDGLAKQGDLEDLRAKHSSLLAELKEED